MNTNHTTQYEQCDTCANWKRLGDERMPDHGECALRGVGHYTHRYTGCVMKPVRWVPKFQERAIRESPLPEERGA